MSGMVKSAVVTGTSSGLGLDLAKDLLEKRWVVYGISRRESAISHPLYRHIRADISKKDEALNAALSLVDVKVDLLVNNSSIFHSAFFAEETLDRIESIIDTNVKGTMYITHSILPLMGEYGKIVFINSVAGLEELENQSIYCASKYAITGFAGVLGKELRSRKIKVSSIHPGGIQTPLWGENNPYPPGNIEQALTTKNVIDSINHIIYLPFNIEIKTLKMFPDIEWH